MHQSCSSPSINLTKQRQDGTLVWFFCCLINCSMQYCYGTLGTLQRLYNVCSVYIQGLYSCWNSYSYKMHSFLRKKTNPANTQTWSNFIQFTSISGITCPSVVVITQNNGVETALADSFGQITNPM